jgi:hypothetical protein
MILSNDTIYSIKHDIKAGASYLKDLSSKEFFGYSALTIIISLSCLGILNFVIWYILTYAGNNWEII